MEIPINKISIAHKKEKIIKIFDNSEECIEFADKFEKEYNIKLSCDTIHAYLVSIKNKGFWEGHKKVSK